MKVSDLVRELNLTVFCGEAGLDAEISGGYTSDLLSDVMGHIDEGMLWVTMQTHQNIVAVATLKDVAAVLIVNRTRKRLRKEKRKTCLCSERRFPHSK